MDAQNPDYDLLKDDDVRYFPRWEVEDNVSYHLEGESEVHSGKTKDISCAGACIATGGTQIAPHQKVKITIQITDDITVNLNGHILWVKNENGQPLMGVTFYNTPDSAQDTILQHAFEIDREKVLAQWFKGWDGS